jgi:uncharacterized protein (DUF2249 family)
MILDIRELNHSVRPSTVFRTFDALAVGDYFELVNDHDPMGLARFFEAMRPGTFRWDYLESGPMVWRVRISRTAPKNAEEPDASTAQCGCTHG